MSLYKLRPHPSEFIVLGRHQHLLYPERLWGLKSIPFSQFLSLFSLPVMAEVPNSSNGPANIDSDKPSSIMIEKAQSTDIAEGVSQFDAKAAQRLLRKLDVRLVPFLALLYL